MTNLEALLFSLGTPVSSTDKTYQHDITEILLKWRYARNHNNTHKKGAKRGVCVDIRHVMLMSLLLRFHTHFSRIIKTDDTA